MTGPDEQPELLLTPGPLTTSPTVKAAMLRDWGSRSPAFAALTARVRSRLATLVGGQDTHVCVPVQGSGTFAVEAMLGSLVPRDEGKVLILVNGTYGRRMGTICQALGLDHVDAETAEDTPPDPRHLATLLEQDPSITHVAVVHCETTSGILNPLEELADVIAAAGRRLLVDAISTLGALPLDVVRLRADAVVTSANKCLQGIPGFAVVLVDQEVLAASAGRAPSLSLDLHAQAEHLDRTGQWRFTPPTQVVAALGAALEELEAEGGVAGRGERYASNMAILRAGLRDLGLVTYVRDEHQAPIILTLLEPPEPGFDLEALVSALARRGVVIYPGAVDRAPTFRVGCIGALGELEMRRALAAFREALEELPPLTPTSALRLPAPALTPEQRESFHREGYVHVPGGLAPELVTRLGAWARELEARPEVPGGHWVYHGTNTRDGTDLVERIEYLAPVHAGFAALAQALRAPAGEIFGEDAYLFKEKFIPKRPGGGGFEPHQDVQAGWDEYAEDFVTVVVSLDEATEETGYLEVAPGRHTKGKLRGREALTSEDVPGEEFVPCPTAPGDFVLLDGYTPHRSGPNRGSCERRLYFATFTRASQGDHWRRYHAEKFADFPPDISRDPDRDYRYEI